MVSVMKVEKAALESYADIGGLDAQIQEIKEAVELSLTHLEWYEDIDIKPSKGVILYGEPGTRETLLAKLFPNPFDPTDDEHYYVPGEAVYERAGAEEDATEEHRQLPSQPPRHRRRHQIFSCTLSLFHKHTAFPVVPPTTLSDFPTSVRGSAMRCESGLGLKPNSPSGLKLDPYIGRDQIVENPRSVPPTLPPPRPTDDEREQDSRGSGTSFQQQHDWEDVVNEAVAGPSDPTSPHPAPDLRCRSHCSASP